MNTSIVGFFCKKKSLKEKEGEKKFFCLVFRKGFFKAFSTMGDDENRPIGTNYTDKVGRKISARPDKNGEKIN